MFDESFSFLAYCLPVCRSHFLFIVSPYFLFFLHYFYFLLPLAFASFFSLTFYSHLYILLQIGVFGFIPLFVSLFLSLYFTSFIMIYRRKCWFRIGLSFSSFSISPFLSLSFSLVLKSLIGVLNGSLYFSSFLSLSLFFFLFFSRSVSISLFPSLSLTHSPTHSHASAQLTYYFLFFLCFLRQDTSPVGDRCTGSARFLAVLPRATCCCAVRHLTLDPCASQPAGSEPKQRWGRPQFRGSCGVA